MASGVVNQEMRALKTGKWSPVEDNKLVAYINRYGIWNWNEMPKFAGLSRSGKSCRLRWMNYLQPNIKRGNFSREEDEIIFKLHQTLGSRWSKIAASLPGRSDNEIKNRWHARMKKQKEQPKQKPHTKILSSCKANKKSINKWITLPVNEEKVCILESSSISPSNIIESRQEAEERLGVKENTCSSETLGNHQGSLLANGGYVLENSNISYSSTGSDLEIGEIMAIRGDTGSYYPMVELHDSFWAQSFPLEAFKASNYYPENMIQSYRSLVKEPTSPGRIFSDENTNFWSTSLWKLD